MKFICITDDKFAELDDRTNALRLRVPYPQTVGDVVAVILNSASVDINGEPRKELRIYTLKPDGSKIPPRYHIGSINRGETVFELSDFNLFIYTIEPAVPFMKLRQLLSASEVDVCDVFAEFDRQIFRLSKAGRLAVDQPGADKLYETATKCKARLFGTTFEAEAESSFRQAVRRLAKIIGMEVNCDGKPCDQEPTFFA